MQLKQFFLLVAVASSAFAQTATNPALAPLETPPAACEAKCAILDQLNSVDPTNLASLSAVCTQQAAAAFLDCINCFQTNSPSTFTPEVMTALQQSADSLTTGCLLVGSPVSSVVIPSATGSATGGGSTTPSNTAGTTPSSTPTPGGAVSTAANGLLAVLAAAAGAVFVL